MGHRCMPRQQQEAAEGAGRPKPQAQRPLPQALQQGGQQLGQQFLGHAAAAYSKIMLHAPPEVMLSLCPAKSNHLIADTTFW